MHTNSHQHLLSLAPSLLRIGSQKAGIEDVKWIITHMKKLHRIALVSDSNVWQWLVKIDSYFAKMVGIGEKYFDSSEIDKAWAWVKK